MTEDKNGKDLPVMLTISEVAEYLKLHELTVRRLAREGELPAFKVGRQWRIQRAKLQDWIDARSGQGAPDQETEGA
jgi:excisionase family DNA binding protein